MANMGYPSPEMDVAAVAVVVARSSLPWTARRQRLVTEGTKVLQTEETLRVPGQLQCGRLVELAVMSIKQHANSNSRAHKEIEIITGLDKMESQTETQAVHVEEHVLTV